MNKKKRLKSTKTAVDYLYERLSTLYLFKDQPLAKRALKEAMEKEHTHPKKRKDFAEKLTAVEYLYERLSTLYMLKDQPLAKRALQEAKAMEKKHTHLKKRKDFAQKLAEKLRATGLGEIDEGAFGDNSGRWVSIRVNDQSLCFSFDMKGEAIDRIGLYKDKVEVTGQIRIWGTYDSLPDKKTDK